MSRAAFLLSLIVALSACEERERPPPAPTRDAGPRRDAGGPMDAAIPPRGDAGPPGPAVDGVLDDPEWDDAVVVENTLATNRPGSTLGRMLAYLGDDRLYVGIEATLATGDALVGWVDAEVGAAGGVDDFSTLADTDQPLDAALSQDLDVPAAFAPELGFGTTRMARAAVGRDADTGWRQLANPASFTWIEGEEAPFVCSETACEGWVSLGRLGGSPPRIVGLFARIVTEGGTLTNQTLPYDSPAAPSVVRAWLELEEGAVIRDAGPPDAGAPDAGTPGGALTFDGVVVDGEWAGATAVDNTVAPAGGFAGNALTTLYALRDAEYLNLAVVGTLTASNAIVVYIDHDYGGGDGLASPTPLDDTSGGLDNALSKSLVTPAEMRVDFAWGTLGFDRSGPVDDGHGWRDVSTDPTNFRIVSAGTICGADACEARIRLFDLGVAPSAEIALFARLVDANSLAFSNQCLPEDDPSAPEIVNELVILSP